jgi:hypothetical protein
MTQVEFHFDFGSPNAYLAHLCLGTEEGPHSKSNYQADF